VVVYCSSFPEESVKPLFTARVVGPRSRPLRREGALSPASVVVSQVGMTSGASGYRRLRHARLSGAGEYIVRSMLAKTIADSLVTSQDADPHTVLQDCLGTHLRRVCLNREASPNAGVLLLAKEADENGAITPRLWCAFTTDGMAIAYASSLDPKPHARILRKPTSQISQTASVYITSLSLTV